MNIVIIDNAKWDYDPILHKLTFIESIKEEKIEKPKKVKKTKKETEN